MKKKKVEELTDEELREAYDREVMEYHLSNVRREKKRRKIQKLYYIFAIVAIILFFVIMGPAMYNDLNTVGQAIP